ncbi:helix-turn-helix transcriptional regulator [Pseudomonas sp. RIT-PI-S]|uniref:AraC family transcriptional regulator n=1 Tax=Pseudomonas sp. RIT-PI-S TaxID=3035295 RepID=UPI0021D8DEC7|nr:helix-turn-helix transcriptional regulator [Pseudomonas sp. RIT-PI-S]
MTPNGQLPPARQIPTFTQLPRPLFARAERLGAGSWTPRHRHPWVQFSYAISGVLAVHTEHGSYFAPPQWGVWIPAGVEHWVNTSAQAEMRSLYVDETVAGPPFPRCRVLEVTPLTRELIKAFSAFAADYPLGDSAQARLATVLVDQLHGLAEVSFSVPLPRHAGLLGLCEALVARPDDANSLTAWATELNVSEKTLARLFQRETGLTFRTWRQRVRLLASLGALQGGSSVTQAALACGYESTSAFIAAFKTLFGTTPGEVFRGN